MRMNKKALIGKRYRVNGQTVTLIAFNTWDGVLHACVEDPSTPNPANIPGLEYAWTPFSNLTPMESTNV